MAEGLGTAPAQDPRKSRRGAPTGLRRLPWVISDISLVAPVRDIRLIGPALGAGTANIAAWRKRRPGLKLEKASRMR
jgi:hypothetical protein